MNNNSKALIVVAVILLILIVWYVMRKDKSAEKESTETNTDSDDTSVNTTNTSVDTSVNTSTTSNPPTSTSTSTSTSTTTTPANNITGQITLAKVMPTYYQYKPSQSGYPNTYGKVTGITFPQGKVLTIIQKWQSQSGDGIYYETTENVTASVLDKVTPHFFIKQSDF